MKKLLVLFFLLLTSLCWAQTDPAALDQYFNSQGRSLLTTQQKSKYDSVSVKPTVLTSVSQFTTVNAPAVQHPDGSIYIRKVGTVTGATPGYGAIVFRGPTGYYYERSKGLYLDVRAFSLSDAGIRKAINYAYAAGGGTVFLPVADYAVDTTITLKYNVSLIGEVSVTEQAASNPMARLVAASTLSGPILEVSANTNGGPAVYSQLANGDSARYQGGRIANLDFTGGDRDNKYLQRLRMYGVWGVEVDHCAFTGTKLFAVHTKEVNTLHFHHNTAKGAFYGESVRDSRFYSNAFSGFGVSNGTIARTPFWLTGYRCFNNIITDNMCYNSSANVARPEFNWTFTADAATDALTATAYGLPDYTPVMIFTTSGTLPSPLVDNQTYWIKAVNANSFKVATTYENAVAGTFVNLTTAGSGTLTFSVGRETNFLFNGQQLFGTYNTIISHNRFDQSYGSGAELRGVDGVVFNNNQVLFAGFGNATAQIGLVLEKSANVSVVGNVVDGRAYTGGIGNLSANQTIGITYDGANSFLGNTVKNHTGVDYWNKGAAHIAKFDEQAIVTSSFRNAAGTGDAGNYFNFKQRAASNPIMEFYSGGFSTGNISPSSDGTNNTIAVTLNGTSAANSFRIVGGGWNNGHLRLGNSHLWIAAGDSSLRLSYGSPGSDGAGVNFLENQTARAQSASFYLSGTGRVGGNLRSGSLSVNTASTTTLLNLQASSGANGINLMPNVGTPTESSVQFFTSGSAGYSILGTDANLQIRTGASAGVTKGTTMVTVSPTGVGIAGSLSAGSLSLPAQTANQVFAGPVSGASVAPGFRALIEDDIPLLSPGKVATNTNNRFINDAQLALVNSRTEYPTVAAMKAKVPPLNGHVVTLSGYTTQGDMPAVQFYWDSLSTTADDGATVHQVTGQSTGRWRLLPGEDVPIEIWNPAGNGSTNDAAKILSALTYMAANSGRTLTVDPAKTYYLGTAIDFGFAGTIKIRSRQGARKAIFKLPDTALYPLILRASAKSGSTTLSANAAIGSRTVTFTSVTNFAVGDLINIASATNWPIGSGVKKAEQNIIEGISGTTVTLRHPLMDSYLSSETVTISNYNAATVEIDNVEIQCNDTGNNPVTGLALQYLQKSKVTNSVVKGFQYTGIEPKAMYDFEVAGCTISGANETGEGYGIDPLGGLIYNIHDNKFFGNRKAVDFSGSGSAGPSRLGRVYGNTVTGNTGLNTSGTDWFNSATTGGTSQGFACHEAAENIAFYDNDVVDCYEGFQLRGKDITVENNRISGRCTLPFTSSAGLNHTYRGNSYKSLITDDTQPGGITMDYTKYPNAFLGVGAAPTGYIHFINNNTDFSRNYGVYIDGTNTAAITVKNNTFYFNTLGSADANPPVVQYDATNHQIQRLVVRENVAIAGSGVSLRALTVITKAGGYSGAAINWANSEVQMLRADNGVLAMTRENGSALTSYNLSRVMINKIDGTFELTGVAYATLAATGKPAITGIPGFVDSVDMYFTFSSHNDTAVYTGLLDTTPNLVFGHQAGTYGGSFASATEYYLSFNVKYRTQ
ncbi:hypothetical protein [Larkinella soli]|uniref:hypothetical protein n=1 Tax=Larkinella soli TaxID=1770527 RepID=UPI000FFB14A6|nr:hypothetical protein [Larkinella soli]